MRTSRWREYQVSIGLFNPSRRDEGNRYSFHAVPVVLFTLPPLFKHHQAKSKIDSPLSFAPSCSIGHVQSGQICIVRTTNINIPTGVRIGRTRWIRAVDRYLKNKSQEKANIVCPLIDISIRIEHTRRISRLLCHLFGTVRTLTSKPSIVTCLIRVHELGVNPCVAAKSHWAIEVRMKPSQS